MFAQQLSDCQAVSTFKLILTLHKQVLPICESLAGTIAIFVETPAGRDECITEEILPVLLDAVIEHPTSMPLLTSIATIIQKFSATTAGKQACISAGCQDVLEAISA
jgi:hypothetical protein